MSRVASGTRVVLIGDSHMEALGPRLESALTSRLGAEVRHVEARRGWSTRAYVRSGGVPTLVRDADVVVVELGGNDAAAGIDAAGHAQDVDALLRQIGNRKVVWVGPGVTARADLERYRGPIRQAQKQRVRGAGHRWVDSQPMTRRDELRGDGVHFSAPGYDRWASALVEALAEEEGLDLLPWVGPVSVGVASLFLLGAWLWSRRDEP